MTIERATYSPDDNKLRLYPACRLDAEDFQRVKAAGYRWAPRQEIFVAPMWTPKRADLAVELAGEIGDEDTSLTERAEERAERFGEYAEARSRDATQAHAAVAAIADNIPMGQPILVGHHSEKRARKDAERIRSGMRRAVTMWETSTYWTDRARGAIRHAKYKERPDVRARRIKKIEAEERKTKKDRDRAAYGLKLWRAVHEDGGAIKRKDGTPSTFAERTLYLANGELSPFGLWSDLKDGKTTPEQAQAQALEVHAATVAHCDRWLEHYAGRLAYERAMQADAGGTVADRKHPEKGGACRCWASPRGGWSYIQKVNKISVTVFDNWGNGGANFTRTIPFDKLGAVMTAAEVQDARDTGRLLDVEAHDANGNVRGFVLRDSLPPTPPPAPAPTEPEPGALTAETVAALKDTLRAGVTTITAPDLFPTPPDLARRMATAAAIEPGHRVLEPSAGTGNLVAAILDALHGGDCGRVVAVEHSPQVVQALTQRRSRTLYATEDSYGIVCADFLTCQVDPPPAGESHEYGAHVLGTFHRVVMNPPFSRGEDVKHILYALTFLKPGGRLVALCANGPRQEKALRPLAASWEPLPAGTFKSEGTNVNVVLVVMEASPSEADGQACLAL